MILLTFLLGLSIWNLHSCSIILTLLISSITDIIRDFISSLAASGYLNVKVSNKKAVATLDTEKNELNVF